MNRETIDDVICAILYQDGPDRHIDGHEIISDFVMAVAEGFPDAWLEKHPQYKTLKGKS
jgi:hypothetical protein